MFDLDDEETAFAYAEGRARVADTRLALSNRASDRLDALMRAGQMQDLDAMVDCYTPGFEYDDRRKLRGNPIRDLRAVAKQILSQYSRFEARVLAVRGEHLQLAKCRWSNDSGFETTHLIVNETGEAGRFIYEARFDEDEFEDACRMLDMRYYADEGSEFAEAGAIATAFMTAVAEGDFDRVFNELIAPDFYVENRSRSVLNDRRSAAEFRATTEELAAMVDSLRIWFPATCWLSPTCGVCRNEREATGLDGEKYAWSDLVAFVIRDGRAASACMFELGDEEAAFAYAEEQVRLAEEG
jgi:hypothetical protein